MIKLKCKTKNLIIIQLLFDTINLYEYNVRTMKQKYNLKNYNENVKNIVRYI